MAFIAQNVRQLSATRFTIYIRKYAEAVNNFAKFSEVLFWSFDRI